MFEANSLHPGTLVFVGIECLITSFDKSTQAWIATMDAIGFIIATDVIQISDEYGYKISNVLCMLTGHGLFYVPCSSLIKAERFDRFIEAREEEMKKDMKCLIGQLKLPQAPSE